MSAKSRLRRYPCMHHQSPPTIYDVYSGLSLCRYTPDWSRWGTCSPTSIGSWSRKRYCCCECSCMALSYCNDTHIVQHLDWNSADILQRGRVLREHQEGLGAHKQSQPAPKRCTLHFVLIRLHNTVWSSASLGVVSAPSSLDDLECFAHNNFTLGFHYSRL
jgi:hypothetical protein